MRHQINSQLTPRPAHRAGLGAITQYSVSWLNPSGDWQAIYNGPDGPIAQASGAQYEANGYAVDAWVYDDQTGWQLQHWSTASTGVTATAPPPKPAPASSGVPWALIGVGAVALAAVGAMALSGK